MDNKNKYIDEYTGEKLEKKLNLFFGRYAYKFFKTKFNVSVDANRASFMDTLDFFKVSVKKQDKQVAEMYIGDFEIIVFDTNKKVNFSELMTDEVRKNIQKRLFGHMTGYEHDWINYHVEKENARFISDPYLQATKLYKEHEKVLKNIYAGLSSEEETAELSK